MKQQTEQENMLHLPKFKSGEFFNTDIIKYTWERKKKVFINLKIIIIIINKNTRLKKFKWSF